MLYDKEYHRFIYCIYNYSEKSGSNLLIRKVRLQSSRNESQAPIFRQGKTAQIF